MLIARAVRGVLKLRYLVLGGAVGGGVTLQKVSCHIKIYLRFCYNLMFLKEISRLEGRTT